MGKKIAKKLILLTVQILMVGMANAQQKHEFVDLGLPSGTLWATCNIGASSPEDNGDYFAWGEIEPGSLDPNTFSNYPKKLPAANDAATHNWGSDWCTPTYEQFCELLNNSNCSWTWTGKGYNVKSNNNGKSIFFPAAGRKLLISIDGDGETGSYWSSSYSEDNPWSLFFDTDYYDTVKLLTSSLNLCSVRPVRCKK